MKKIKGYIPDLVKAFQEKGFDSLDNIIPDGEIHRFKGQKNKDDCWYVCHRIDEDVYICVAGDWANPFKTAKILSSPGGVSEFKMKEIKAKVISEINRKKQMKESYHEVVALEALGLFEKAEADASHPYLEAKGLSSAHGSKVLGEKLLIPMLDFECKLWGLQQISSDGTKMFLKGQRAKALMFFIGKEVEPQTVFLCEGFATAASLFEATEKMSVCSFSAANLLPVSQSLRRLYPEARIVIAADVDKSGAGAEWAEKAAKASRGFVIYPPFSPDEKASDFNDLALQSGLSAIQDICASQFQKQADEIKDFCYGWLKKHATCDAHRFFSYDRGEIDYQSLLTELKCAANLYKPSMKQELVGRLFDRWVVSETEKARKAIMDKILPFEEGGLMELMRFSETITPGEEMAYPIWYHFLWQIKRKMLRLPVFHHMMPVLVGKSGVGKTIAVRKLLEPIKDLYLSRSLSGLDDDRAFKMFEENYVIYFDEMSELRRRGVNHEFFKNLVTEEKLSFRPMRSNITVSVRQNCTFIGSSNDRLSNIIKDPLSSRRFYELESMSERNDEAINSIDYVKLWKAIDPFDKSPMEEPDILARVYEHQEAERYRSDIEEWIDEIELQPSTETVTSIDRLFDSYKNWRIENDGFPHSKKSLVQNLKTLGYKKTEKRYREGNKKPHFLFCFSTEIQGRVPY